MYVDYAIRLVQSYCKISKNNNPKQKINLSFWLVMSWKSDRVKIKFYQFPKIAFFEGMY